MKHRTDSLLFPFCPAGRHGRKASSARIIRWVGFAVLGLTALAVLPGHASGQGTVTTSDGLELSLAANGSVNSLKIGTTNYGGTLPSGFFYREPAISSANQAVNGSFESGSGVPTGWSIPTGGAGTWSIDSGNASAGLRSMKLSIPGSTPQRSRDLMTIAQFSLKPNTPYKFSASMKTSGLTSGLTLYLLEEDSSGNWTQMGVSSLTGTNGWKTYSKTIFTGPNAVQGYLKAYVSNGYGTAWLDDIRLNDVFGGDQPVAFGGSVSSPGGVLTQTASTNGLNFTAKYTNVGSAIKVDATLTDTTGADRGVEVAFRLPLDIAGWTWDNDFVTPVTIESGIRYEKPDTHFAGQTLGHTHSIYPFATVRNSTAAFSMAVPMGPLMDRFAYDDTQGFRVTYDVGLSSATTSSPSTAKFSFWIYTHSAKWGMRAAAEKYYALNPTSFTSAATVRGAWALKNTLPLSSVANHQDFGWGYEETDTDLGFDNANGIVGLHYMSFPAWDINIAGYPSQPPYSVLVAALAAAQGAGGNTVDGIPKADMADATVASAPHDENGLYPLSWHSYFWYGNRLQMYPVAAYSALSAGTADLRLQYSVDNQIEGAEDDGDVLGGIFLDNTTYVFGNIENYRKSLWAYNIHSPLSFSYKTGETIQYLGDSMFDFTKALRNHLNQQGKILMASITPGTYVWFAHNIDVVGGEVQGAEVLDRAYARRTLGYGKMWSNLYVPGTIIPTQAQVLAYFRQALLLGFFPGFNGLYWDSSPTYERDRGLFKLYMPKIKTVIQAGWKPVNYAKSSSTSTLIERFGNASSGTFYVTAQNSGTSITAVTLTIDGAGLGIPSSTPVTVLEMLSNTSRAVTRTGTDIKISETLDPGETVAYAVTPSGAVAGPPAANFTWSPANPSAGQSVQFTDTSTNTPTTWSWTSATASPPRSRVPLMPSLRPARTRFNSPRRTPAEATSANIP